MLSVGSLNVLEVVKEVDFGIYLGSDRGEILLPRKSVPEDTKIGDQLEVFIYTDSEDRLIATTSHPFAMVGEFAGLKVKDVTKFGAFLDWGLEKDLLVPFRQQLSPMRPGRTYLVRVCLDEVSQRVIAVSKLRPFLEGDPTQLAVGQKVSLLVAEHTETGLSVLVDESCVGLLYHNEVFEKLEVGDRRDGYVKLVREDGKVDVSLQPQGYRALMGEAPRILETLEAAGGFLPCNAKSDPKTISEQFGLSKKAFKKLIGGLYKDGRIEITDDGMRLRE